MQRFQALDDAYQAGIQAYREGKPMTSNPHLYGGSPRLTAEWMRGYRAAKEQDQREQPHVA
jgi:hypothetical protein